MNTNTTARATPYQRAEIIRKLKALELDTKHLTFMHRRVGAPENLIQSGARVEAWLDELDAAQASALIGKMGGML
jgi:hypothetical protein